MFAHEFIHFVISKKSRNKVPIWLHEGIAKYYESSWRTKPEALSASSEKLLEEAVRNGGLITFEQMHLNAKLPSQESEALAFAEVFTMIEFSTFTARGAYLLLGTSVNLNRSTAHLRSSMARHF